MSKKIAAIIILVLIAVNLFFGLPRLANYSAVDEPYWTYDRISQFWSSVKNQKWRSTSVNDKPGITVALVTGPGYAYSDPMPLKSLRDDIKSDEQLAAISQVNFRLRLPIYLFGVLSIIAFYLLLRKLLGEPAAIFSTILIGLSPIILGISLIINPDSLLWIFAPLTIISWLAFRKSEEKKYLYLSGIFLGLSLLTKYVANILYVYFLGLIFLEYILSERKTDVEEYLVKSFKEYAVLIFFSVLTFFVLYPATWVNPERLLEGTFLSQAFRSTWPVFVLLLVAIFFDMLFLKSKASGFVMDFFRTYKETILKILIGIFLATSLLAIANVYTGMKAIDFESIMASPKSGDDATFALIPFFETMLADVYELLFGLTPVAFIGLIIAILSSLRGKLSFERTKIIFYLLFFILLYFTASTANFVSATVRYQIMNYVLASIIAGIGLEYFFGIISAKYQKFSLSPAALFLIIISSVSLFFVRPHYLSYASFLLPEEYILNLKGMGDGSFEAGRYLNSKPNARELTIWSDKGAVCEAFVGDCIIGVSKKDLEGREIDYLVVSTDRKSKFTRSPGELRRTIDINKLYDGETEAEHEIIIDGRPDNFVKIVSADLVTKR